jgi:hypothetical protein
MKMMLAGPELLFFLTKKLREVSPVVVSRFLGVSGPRRQHSCEMAIDCNALRLTTTSSRNRRCIHL